MSTQNTPYFVHPKALLESAHIGKGTKIWDFAHVLDGAVIGDDCNICSGVFIESKAVIGDRVTVKCGVQVWDGVIIEDDVFVGPNATFTNDKFPRSKKHLDGYPVTRIQKGASLGANCTILPGVTVGQKAMIGAGAVVTKDVPPNSVVVGNPARIVGYVDAPKITTAKSDQLIGPGEKFKALEVGGAALYRIPTFSDMRGRLSVGEVGKELPFQPVRFFTVFDVPNEKVRGEHAHKECHQFLLCVSGSCRVLVDDGTNRLEVYLNSSEVGIHLPPMVWGTQYNYSPGAVLLVFASHSYDANDYIRTYEEFQKELAAKR